MGKHFDPKDFNGEVITDPQIKAKLLDDFVSFVLGMSLKEFQRARRRFIWEIVPATLSGRTIVRGAPAFEAFHKQWPADFYYIYGGYETESFQIFKISASALPDIATFARGDYTLAHKNFKWALIRSHEEGEMPIGDPIFISRI